MRLGRKKKDGCNSDQCCCAFVFGLHCVQSLKPTGFGSHLCSRHVLLILANSESQRGTKHASDATTSGKERNTKTRWAISSSQWLRQRGRGQRYLMLMKLLVVKWIFSARRSNSFTPSYKVRRLQQRRDHFHQVLLDQWASFFFFFFWTYISHGSPVIGHNVTVLLFAACALRQMQPLLLRSLSSSCSWSHLGMPRGRWRWESILPGRSSGL